MTVAKTTKTTLALTCLSIALGGCGWFKNSSPDEFAIVDQPALVVPPDFTLRPPRPGEPTTQTVAPSSDVVNALFPGRTSLPPEASAGEQALLREIGADDATSDVRSTMESADDQTVEKGALLADILSADDRDGEADASEIRRVDSEELDDPEDDN